jgi:glycosyltransferase involved in cell wall biosynthesis
VYLSIDKTLFNDTGEKKLQIAHMSRKCPEDIHQVVELARQHPALAKFSFIDIQQLSLQEVAKIMRESLIFLSTSFREGFGLPPAEAMACGCLVVGYHGQGGKEFMNPECCFPIEQGDVQGFVRKVVELGEVLSHNATHFDALRASAAQQITGTYNPLKEKESLLAFWRQLIT